MAILHGSWTLDGSFLLWGEVWQAPKPIVVDASSPQVPSYPLALDEAALGQLVAAQLSGLETTSWARAQATISMPTALAPTKRGRKKKTERATSGATSSLPLNLLAQHSTTKLDTPPPPLYPWRIEGYRLLPAQAVELLEALPLDRKSVV